MKTETKMAILRILVTKYAKEYEIMKWYFFNNTGFSIRAGELADGLQTNICPQLMILNKNALDRWVINNLIDSGISLKKISQTLQMPIETILQMASIAT